MDLLYSIAQAGSGARAHYRLGWAGLGWPLFDTPPCSIQDVGVRSIASFTNSEMLFGDAARVLETWQRISGDARDTFLRFQKGPWGTRNSRALNNYFWRHQKCESETPNMSWELKQ